MKYKVVVKKGALYEGMVVGEFEGPDDRGSFAYAQAFFDWWDRRAPKGVSYGYEAVPMDGESNDDTLEKFLDEWKESASEAQKTLSRFIMLMADWKRSLPSEESFASMVQDMDEQGLEGWLDGHPLDLDKLAAVLGVS